MRLPGAKGIRIFNISIVIDSCCSISLYDITPLPYSLFLLSLLPGLRTIVNAIFHSMKPLIEVMLIMLFLLIIISLIALQAFKGVLRRRCVLMPNATIGFENFTGNFSTYIADKSKYSFLYIAYIIIYG